jgi:uncharacterized protein YqgV (UPF0045/DUF77 family)
VQDTPRVLLELVIDHRLDKKETMETLAKTS